MKSRPTPWLAALAVPLLLAAAAPAQDALSRRDLDRRLEISLYEVSKVGTDLYNRSRDEDGCFYAYAGALRVAVELLDHHPELRTRVMNAMKTAANEPPPQRSFTLRTAIDDIRKTIGARPAAAPMPARAGTDGGGGLPTPAPAPGSAPAVVKRTLWERLGGGAAVKAVVHDFVAATAKNPKVNFSRDGKFKLDDKAVANLEKLLVELISAATGGPLKYSGRDMKTVHAGMKITEAEFNAMAADLNDVMKKLKVGPPEIEELMRIIESTKKDIVEK